jgi:2-polyprenyl-6-methoxyphenol hydroxylase-like FAD-dependent oxidoreductase
MATIDKALIVGAGIGGLTAAAAFEQHGIPVELVERNRDWVALGAGIAVQPNGVRILRQLGLDGFVVDAGAVLQEWRFTDEHSDVLCQADLADLWGDVGPFVGIARSRLQEALVAGARRIPTRLATSIAELIEYDDRVHVTFTDGSEDDYDVVVGADGIHSLVRDHVAGAVVPIFAGQIAWRSLSPFRLPGAPRIQFGLGTDCFFGLCTVGDDLTYGFGNVTTDRLRDPVEGRLTRLRERFAHFGPSVQGFLRGLETDVQVHCSPIEWIELDSWHTSRVVLIGDAAHASSPMMGQGGCLAMEDGWVLAEVLSAEPRVESALKAYAERRHPRVNWVHAQSKAVGDSFRVPPAARNAVLRERGAAMLRDRYAPLKAEP